MIVVWRQGSGGSRRGAEQMFCSRFRWGTIRYLFLPGGGGGSNEWAQNCVRVIC